VRVASLDAPSMVDRGQSFRLTCRIEATGPLAGELKLTRDGELILTRPVEVAPAEPVVVSIVENPDEEGLHVYSAALIARGDRFPQNNALKTPVFVRARLLVAYLAGYEGETPVERLLKRLDGFRFRRLTGAKELTAELLAETSVVVVDDFPAALLGTKDRELASFVREDGGGLMMLGGSGSFGVGGYIETAVDTVLPVHCDPRDARKKPLALVVVLDSSGSMGEGGGRKMDMARAAAVRTLSRLAEADRACVIAFRVAPEVVVPLRSVEDVDGVARKLARIAPVGGTNIYPALRRALKELENSDAPLRHVVILSDGKSQPGDAEAVIALYRSAKVTLSGVATGEDAERPLLARLAAETGGRFYDATDIRRLPELFLDDLRRVDGPLVRKGSLKVEPAEPGDILKDIDLTELPAVEAYNRTRSREGADVLLRHTFEKREEPVLAVRRVGLGRAASLMLSFESGWAGELPRWRPWGNLFVKLLQHVRRSEFPDDYSLRVRRHGRAFEVLVVANSPGVASKARKLAVRLRGRSAPAEVPLVRTGVRTWEGKLETDLEGVVSAVLVEGGGDAASPLVNCYVPQGYPREYAELAPRVDTLERIARVTGGRLVDNLEEFRAAGGRHLREKRDLTPWLVGLVLVLFLTELVGRAAGYL